MTSRHKDLLLSFLCSFSATVLGIALTFGLDGLISSARRTRNAKLLARQAVTRMDRSYSELHEYLDIYDRMDSTSMALHLAILADTLERVDDKVVQTFLDLSLGEYVQADIKNPLEVYKTEILDNIGNVDLLGHIDDFYYLAAQYSDISSQVVDQKRICSDIVYARIYGDTTITERGIVRLLHEMPQFNVLYSRMQNVRFILKQADTQLLEELRACHDILGIPFEIEGAPRDR